MDIFIKTPNTLNFIQLKSNGLKSIQKLDEVLYIYIYIYIWKSQKNLCISYIKGMESKSFKCKCYFFIKWVQLEAKGPWVVEP